MTPTGQFDKITGGNDDDHDFEDDDDDQDFTDHDFNHDHDQGVTKYGLASPHKISPILAPKHVSIDFCDKNALQ